MRQWSRRQLSQNLGQRQPLRSSRSRAKDKSEKKGITQARSALKLPTKPTVGGGGVGGKVSYKQQQEQTEPSLDLSPSRARSRSRIPPRETLGEGWLLLHCAMLPKHLSGSSGAHGGLYRLTKKKTKTCHESRRTRRSRRVAGNRGSNGSERTEIPRAMCRRHRRHHHETKTTTTTTLPHLVLSRAHSIVLASVYHLYLAGVLCCRNTKTHKHTHRTCVPSFELHLCSTAMAKLTKLRCAVGPLRTEQHLLSPTSVRQSNPNEPETSE